MTVASTPVSGPAEENRAAALTALDRSECLRLLSTAAIGRIVVPVGSGARPVIRPVHFAFDHVSQSVVFRSLPGGKLYALLHSTRAAFEADAIDAEGGGGWSVIVEGSAEAVRDPMELRRLERLGVPGWLGGQEARWMRIRARTVSGRRLSTG